MASKISSQLSVTRSVANVQSIGTVPTEIETVSSTSDMVRLSSQVVGTTHEVIDAGDMTDSCMLLLKNTHATAVVQVGVEVGGVFYPLFTIPTNERAKLPRCNTLAGTFIKSSLANTVVEVVLYKIAA